MPDRSARHAFVPPNPFIPPKGRRPHVFSAFEGISGIALVLRRVNLVNLLRRSGGTSFAWVVCNPHDVINESGSENVFITADCWRNIGLKDHCYVVKNTRHNRGSLEAIPSWVRGIRRMRPRASASNNAHRASSGLAAQVAKDECIPLIERLPQVADV